MKNKKGFTLIELLAVIVVLAIIALIATPIVMNTIKNAKKGAAERSADNYIKAVEKVITEIRIDNTIMPDIDYPYPHSKNKIEDGEYQINSDGNLVDYYMKTNDVSIPIEMNGTKPTGGTINIENGSISQDGTMIIIGDYYYGYKNGKMVLTDTNTLLEKNICVNVDGETPYSFGAQYICELGDGEKRIFRVLEDGDKTTLTDSTGRVAQAGEVSLLMDRNLDGDVYWVTKKDYLAAGGTEDNWNKICPDCGNGDLGPITANKALAQQTINWKKITDKTKVSLPTANQISAALGISFNNNVIDISYEDYNHNIWNLLQGYEDTFGNPVDAYVYWTSTVFIDSDSVNAFVWNSFNYSFELLHSLGYAPIDYFRGVGVRPVITVSKSQLG